MGEEMLKNINNSVRNYSKNIISDRSKSNNASLSNK